MSVSKLATALTVIFAVSVVILAAELLFILFRRSRRSSQHQPPINNQNPNNYSTKELLYFFCIKSQTRVEPSGLPTQNPDGGSDNDAVIDVFKMLEENGRPSRILCTIKEEEREEVETVSLQACFESEVAEERGVKADVEVKVFSPCDSPLFFTPIGSPTRDGVSLVTGER